MNELIHQHGLEVVQAYMNHIQESAEIGVRDLLKQVALANSPNPQELACKLHAFDLMDDGTVKPS